MNRRLMLWSAAAFGAAVLWWTTRPAADGPAVAWLLDDGSAQHPASPFQEVTGDQPIRLAITAPEPLYVYVASVDQEDGTLAWFPSPQLRTNVANPLPAGVTTLPGKHDAKDRAFPARPGLAVTQWLVIASRTEQPELQAAMSKLRQLSNSTFTDGSMVISNPKDGPPQGRPKSPAVHALLTAAMAQAPQPNPNGPMQRAGDGLWYATWHTVAAKNAQGEKVTVSPLDKLKPLQAPEVGATPK